MYRKTQIKIDVQSLSNNNLGLLIEKKSGPTCYAFSIL